MVRGETYVKVAGRWVYLYRVIDQFGHVIDVLVSVKLDRADHVMMSPRDSRGPRIRRGDVASDACSGRVATLLKSVLRQSNGPVKGDVHGPQSMIGNCTASAFEIEIQNHNSE